VRPFTEPDRLLRQFERDGLVACAAMAGIALVVQRGRLDGAAGVVAGGALMALSYWAIKGSVDLVADVAHGAGGLAEHPGPDGTPEPIGPGEDGVGSGPGTGRGLSAGRRVGLAMKFLMRYALLAVGAYAMLTCFRVHPVGLLAGATTPFVAAVAQVVRSFRASSWRRHP
jgi:hypothetical protein